MKNKLIPLLFVFAITACSSNAAMSSKFFCFDTVIETHLYEGNKNDIEEIEDIYSYYSKVSDNYQSSDITNVYSINNTNDVLQIDKKLYDMLKVSFDLNKGGLSYFNPLCGSLAKKWKEALKNKQILDENVKNEEILNINNSSISFLEDHKIQRSGEAEIDLGAIAKGYVLDEVKEYLDSKEYKNYLINGGFSSILLGEKKSKDGLFSVGLNDVTNGYLKLKNTFVSTSSKSVQGVLIDNVTYSHIVNPINGSAINENDAVIVLSNSGYIGDALSTSMMLNTVDEIKELENKYEVKTIVIKDKKIIYHHPDVEVLYHS